MWLGHGKITKRLNNSKGLGISEAMLAMAVVAIAALAVSSFIIYQKRDASRLGKSTSCQEVLNWAINSIKSRDNKQTITDCFPWNIDPANGLIVATNYRCQSLDIDPGSTADNFVASYDPTLAGNTAVRGWVNAWNIQNTTQRLTYLINRKAALNENLCSDPGTDWTDSLITQEFGDPSNVITNFTNPQLLLKITRLQSGSPLGANTCLPASTLQLRPRGLASVGGSNLNEDNSYKVDVTFNYVDQNLPKTCSRSTTIGYDGDSMPPSILDMNGGQNSVTLTNGNGVSFINTAIPTSCVSPVDPATRTARLQFKLSEPGSGFECQRKDANDADDGAQWATQPEDDADWTECTALNLIAGDNNTRGIVYRPGSLPDAVPAQGYPQGSYIRVEFRNLPEAHYEMAIRAIDPAGNVGPASVAYLSWYIDETRPSTTNLNPDRVIVGEPGPGIQGSLWGAGDRVPGSWNVPYVQCDQTGTPTFTVSSSSGWLNEGCIWRLTNSPQGSQIAVSDSNGSCSVTLNPPAGSCFQNGSYTLAVDYFDVCGDGAGSQSITWMVDRSDINSATITSGTFDNGMANFNLSASGPQMISWEMQGTLGLITAGGPAALISGASLGYPTGSCTGPGSACAVAYGACGSVKRASGNYQVRGGRGHVCTGIECSAGNTCSRNISSGTCVDPDACDAPGGVFCTGDNQCGNDWGNGGYSAYCDGHEEYLGGCGCGSAGNDSCCAAGAAGDACRLSATRTCTTDANCHSSLQCHGYSAEDPGRCHCQENRGPSGFGPAQPVCPNFTGACATAPGDRGGLAPQCGGGGGGGAGCADTVSNPCVGNPGQSELCIDYDCNGSATDAGECSGCAGPPGPAPTPPCVRYGCASWYDGTACPGAHAPPGWKCDEYSGCNGQPGLPRICYP